MLASRRARIALVVLLVLLPVARIVATYPVFSQTVDEPVHIAGGFDWLTKPGYGLDPEHPPLARIAFGLDAWLHGATIPASAHLRPERGNALLEHDIHYVRNLAAARAGNLPFFIIGIAAVALWTRRLFGDAAALVAMALFGALPPILGHAGLATTDMAPAAMTTAALYMLMVWLDDPSWSRTLLLAATLGLALLTKFSFIGFFPLGALVLMLARSRGGTLGHPRVTHAIGVLAGAALLVWAGYKFDVGTLEDARMTTFPPDSDVSIAARHAKIPGYEWVRTDIIARFHEYVHNAEEMGVRGIDFADWAKSAGYPSPLAGRRGRDTMANAPPVGERSLLEPFRRASHMVAMNVPLPAPYFLAGIEYAHWHSSVGHPAFLLGHVRSDGWWYYFPVVWFFKTPLPFVLLSLGGIALLLKRRSGAEAAGVALAPLVMLLPALTSSINIGIRHILPLYPLLTIPAAYTLLELWRWKRPIALLLAAWLAVETTLAHPDYLAWFNEAAGTHPERIATDSNLDWGQDLLRLATVVRREHLTPISVAYFGSGDIRRHIPGAINLPPHTPAHGWVVVSEMKFAFGDDYAWLTKYTPVRRIGRSIRLYFIP